MEKKILLVSTILFQTLNLTLKPCIITFNQNSKHKITNLKKINQNVSTIYTLNLKLKLRPIKIYFSSRNSKTSNPTKI